MSRAQITRRLLPGLATLVVTVVALSCTGPRIAAQTGVVRTDIKKAKESGAYTCAPKELALAESNVDFAENELAQGDALRAQTHIDIADENANKALAASKGCAPQLQQVKVNGDRDGDGIIDDLDACPDQPEDIDLFEDEDGCPDPDNDQDKVLDVLDKCPNTPGPVDNDGCPYGDRDGDGINDKVDACPDAAEDVDGFEDEDGCPEVDNDKDGILDGVDACPNEPGPLDTRGCPDRDGDGFVDTEDKCPDEKGIDQKATNPARHGCPRDDTDGDGFFDDEDGCPTEPGVRNDSDPSKNGCPRKFKLIVIKKDRIEIKQQVQFDTGKASIKPASARLLAEVGDAIRSSNLSKVTIEGHTDDVGDDAFNLRLSQDRANSVRNWLVDKEGVDGAVLESIGYGEDTPIASNRTKAGKAQNRRVEFKVAR